jgi:hypothetical protein
MVSSPLGTGTNGGVGWSAHTMEAKAKQATRAKILFMLLPSNWKNWMTIIYLKNLAKLYPPTPSIVTLNPSKIESLSPWTKGFSKNNFMSLKKPNIEGGFTALSM